MIMIEHSPNDNHVINTESVCNCAVTKRLMGDCVSVRLSVTFHLTCFFSVCFHQILMQLDKNDVMAMGYEVTERILNICIN